MEKSSAMTAAETTRLIRARKISPQEVIEETIGRIENRNPSLGAIVHLDLDSAREAARNLDAQRPGKVPGILHGVPTATTELFTTYPGWPSSLGGIPALKNAKGAARSLYPRRMEASEAVMLGFTNSSPFGFTPICDNRLFGPTSNPFDIRMNAGGSVGGSAAAVADGLVPIAGGLDGGGGIRLSAAWCGVFGFQSSYGRVPRSTRPSAFEVSPFAYDGAFTRTVEDGAMAVNVLSGYDEDDPFSFPLEIDMMQALNRSIRGRRIGFAPRLGGFPVSSSILTVLTDAMAAFESNGAEIVPLDVTLAYTAEDICRAWRRMVSMRMAGALNGMKKRGIDLYRDFRDDVSEEAWLSIEQANSISLSEMQLDQQIRTAVFDGLQNALSKVDVIACPASGVSPVANTKAGVTSSPQSVDGVPVDPVVGWCLGFLTNFSGNPSASLPAGMAGGLPVGLQLIGKRHGDFDLLSMCSAFEIARPWMASYSQCAERPLVAQ